MVKNCRPVEIQREVSVTAYDKIIEKKVGEKRLDKYNCQEPWVN